LILTICSVYFGYASVNVFNYWKFLNADLSLLLLYFQPWEDEPETSYIREYPITPIQFILYLYHNQPDFVPICMTSDFLTALSATLFPHRCSSEVNSEVVTPQDDFKVLLINLSCLRLTIIWGKLPYVVMFFIVQFGNCTQFQKNWLPRCQWQVYFHTGLVLITDHLPIWPSAFLRWNYFTKYCLFPNKIASKAISV